MEQRFPPPLKSAALAHPKAADGMRRYADSIEHSEVFWARVAERLDWIKKPVRIQDTSLRLPDFHIRWFEDGVLNTSVNCLDRHLDARGDKTAIVFQSDDPAESRPISYRALHTEVCHFANALRNLGINKGTRVVLYLPMIPEAVVAMLACARIGAIHAIVSGSISPDALAQRIADCTAKLVITADAGRRGGKSIPYKTHVDTALAHPGTNSVETVVVVRRSGAAIPMQAPRDRWWHVLSEGQPDLCTPEPMHAEDPLFILYGSNSSDPPQGVLHSTAGYLLYASFTHEQVFDLRDDDVYWCSADLGQIAGHSYSVYGPLSNGATSLLFEGLPTWPDSNRYRQIIDTHQVSVLYTSTPTLRTLLHATEAPIKAALNASLRQLGTFSEPTHPKTGSEYQQIVSERRDPIIDTWMQAATGGILFAPLPGTPIVNKPGSVRRPFYGIQPAIVNGDGKVLEGAGTGKLVMTTSWPGQIRTFYGDHQRFLDTYFTVCPGYYFTGKRARRDKDGDYWITSEVDDV